MKDQVTPKIYSMFHNGLVVSINNKELQSDLKRINGTVETNNID